LSLHETAEIVLGSNFKIWQFIIQELYYMSAVYYRTKGNIPRSDGSFSHHDTRQCLFDFNDNKNTIAYTLGGVSICPDCESKFDKQMVPADFVQTIEKELKRIRKGFYYRARDFVTERPIISIVIATIFAMVVNILSNLVFDILKSK
jgi:hypothetical protein